MLPENMKTTEHREQAALVSTVLLTYQNRSDFIRPLFFSTLSGAWIGGSGKSGRSALISKYKSEGGSMVPADLLYLQPRGGYAYLAIRNEDPERIRESTAARLRIRLNG